jgi:uncharacterized phage protein gp47/JayE
VNKIPITDTSVYRTRADILAEMLAMLQSGIADFYVGEDGVGRMILDIDAAQYENAFLGLQLLLEDMFVQHASLQALRLHAIENGVEIHDGVRSTGSVTFEGAAGTYIPVATTIAHDPGQGLGAVYFKTTVDGTIPSPGDPTAPTAAINVAAGNLNGLYEYVVTFVTADGEGLPSPVSNAVSPATQKIDLTAIPTGGTGTTKRRIYRDKNGAGVFRRVTEITDNTTTTFTDNVTDATVAGGALVPIVDQAHKLTLTAQAEQPGSEGNVASGTITELASAPSALTGVANAGPFTGGEDQEDTEKLRQRVLEAKQRPGSSSALDLKFVIENITGVESATIFENDNLGTPTNGHTTIRITGPGGSVPPSDVVAAAQAAADEMDMINVTTHVTTFIAQPTNVTVDVTTSGTFTLGDVTPSVEDAIARYVNALQSGETLYLSGIVAVVKPLSGIADVVVTTPASNQSTASDHKRTIGTVSVV